MIKSPAMTTTSHRHHHHLTIFNMTLVLVVVFVTIKVGVAQRFELEEIAQQLRATLEQGGNRLDGEGRAQAWHKMDYLGGKILARSRLVQTRLANHPKYDLTELVEASEQLSEMLADTKRAFEESNWAVGGGVDTLLKPLLDKEEQVVRMLRAYFVAPRYWVR